PSHHTLPASSAARSVSEMDGNTLRKALRIGVVSSQRRTRESPVARATQASPVQSSPTSQPSAAKSARTSTSTASPNHFKTNWTTPPIARPRSVINESAAFIPCLRSTLQKQHNQRDGRSARLRSPRLRRNQSQSAKQVAHALALFAQLLVRGGHTLAGKVVALEPLHDFGLAVLADHGQGVEHAGFDTVAPVGGNGHARPVVRGRALHPVTH